MVYTINRSVKTLKEQSQVASDSLNSILRFLPCSVSLGSQEFVNILYYIYPFQFSHVIPTGGRINRAVWIKSERGVLAKVKKPLTPRECQRQVAK